MKCRYPVSADLGIGIIIAVIIEVLLCCIFVIQPFIIGIFIIVVGGYIYTYITASRLRAIEISDTLESITFENKTLLGKIESETYSFKTVYFTYRGRTVYGEFGTYPRIQTRNVCIVDCARKTLAVLEPDVDGWTDGSIRVFVQKLKASGVNRVVEKYGDSEVEI